MVLVLSKVDLELRTENPSTGEPGGSIFEVLALLEFSKKGPKMITQTKIPPVDVNTPSHFETITFALG